MSSSDGKVEILINAVDNASAKINKISGAVKGMISIAAVVIAFKKVKSIVKDLTTAYMEQEQADMLMKNAMEQSGIYSDILFQKYSQLANAIQSRTIYGNEEIQQMQTWLIRAKVNEAQMEKTTMAVLDFATATKMNATQAGKEMAKLLDGQTNSLGRFGIQVIRAADGTVDFNRTLAQFQKYSGLAEGAAETLNGRIKQVENAFGDVKKEVGRFIGVALQPYLQVITDELTTLEGAVKNSKDTQDKFNDGAGKMANVLRILGRALIIIRETFKSVGKTLGDTYTVALQPFILTIQAAALAVNHLRLGWLKVFDKKNTQAIQDTEAKIADLNQEFQITIDTMEIAAKDILSGKHFKESLDSISKYDEKFDDINKKVGIHVEGLKKIAKQNKKTVDDTEEISDNMEKTKEETIEWKLESYDALTGIEKIADEMTKINAIMGQIQKTTDTWVDRILELVGGLGADENQQKGLGKFLNIFITQLSALASLASGDIGGALSGAMGSLDAIGNFLFSPFKKHAGNYVAQHEQIVNIKRNEKIITPQQEPKFEKVEITGYDELLKIIAPKLYEYSKRGRLFISKSAVVQGV